MSLLMKKKAMNNPLKWHRGFVIFFFLSKLMSETRTLADVVCPYVDSGNGENCLEYPRRKENAFLRMKLERNPCQIWTLW